MEACDDRVQFGPCASSSPTGMAAIIMDREGGLGACRPGHGLFVSGVLCLYRRLGDLRSSRNVDRRRGPYRVLVGRRGKDLERRHATHHHPFFSCSDVPVGPGLLRAIPVMPVSPRPTRPAPSHTIMVTMAMTAAPNSAGPQQQAHFPWQPASPARVRMEEGHAATLATQPPNRCGRPVSLAPPPSLSRPPRPDLSLLKSET